jgi:hypothetical protein
MVPEAPEGEVLRFTGRVMGGAGEAGDIFCDEICCWGEGKKAPVIVKAMTRQIRAARMMAPAIFRYPLLLEGGDVIRYSVTGFFDILKGFP